MVYIWYTDHREGGFPGDSCAICRFPPYIQRFRLRPRRCAPVEHIVSMNEKGSMEMNILFLLTPKSACAYVREEDTIRQALERMSASGYSAVPILAKDGTYKGTLTEGDLLWAIKDLYLMDMREAETHGIMDIRHRKDNSPVTVTTPAEALLSKAAEQNFVPVVDDRNIFIGIVTRRAIMRQVLDAGSGEKVLQKDKNHPPKKEAAAAFG